MLQTQDQVVDMICILSFPHSYRSDQQSSPGQDEEEVQRRQMSQPSMVTGDIFFGVLFKMTKFALKSVSGPVKIGSFKH